jgi:3-oxoadipate enol-lactonase
METRQTGNDLIILSTDATFSYDDMGEGPEVIIFIHGFPFDKNMWKPQMEFFKDTRRVIAYDISSFGKSTNNAETQTINGFSDDLIKLMDALRISQCIVCGLSMGGYIALNALKRFPGRFSGLILADTQCAADTAEAKENRYKTIQQVEEEGVTNFGEGFIKKAFYKQSLENKKEVVEKIKRVVLSNTTKAIKQGLKALAERSETCSSLVTIHVPTLIICGKEDELTPIEKSKFMHDQIKGSVLKIIEEAGHLSNIEQLDEFNKAMEEFLKVST